jgi:hypothetical protein
VHGGVEAVAHLGAITVMPCLAKTATISFIVRSMPSRSAAFCSRCSGVTASSARRRLS